METSFQASTKREIHVAEGMITQHLAHKTPPRVPPKPTSKSPPSYVSKVTAGRQQSPSPVRHVKGPTPTPVRYATVISVKAGGHLNWLHELTDLRVVVYRPVSPSTKLSVSPIRPVKSPIMTRKQVRASIWSLLSLSRCCNSDLVYMPRFVWLFSLLISKYQKKHEMLHIPCI